MDCGPSGSSVHGDSPGKNTEVGCHALLQIFPTKGLNPGLLHCRQILYRISQGKHLNTTAAAAAAAKSLQSCPTLCDPIDGSPLGSSVPGILQARVLEWGAIAFSRYYHYLTETVVIASKILILLYSVPSHSWFLPISYVFCITIAFCNHKYYYLFLSEYY